MLQIKLNICIFQKTKQFKLCKGGVGGPNVPKILARSTQFWQCQDFGNIWSPNPSLSVVVLKKCSFRCKFLVRYKSFWQSNRYCSSIQGNVVQSDLIWPLLQDCSGQPLTPINASTLYLSKLLNVFV